MDLHDVSDLIRAHITDLREENAACEDAADDDECDVFCAEITQWERALMVVRDADHRLNHA